MLCVLTVGFIFQIIHANLCAVMYVTEILYIVKQTKANVKIIGNKIISLFSFQLQWTED